MIEAEMNGDFTQTIAWLKRLQNGSPMKHAERYAKEGVQALAAATPKESGESAEGWTYRITEEKGNYTIEWHNTHMKDGVPIVILLQYGHGQNHGGYVQGRDFINPAIRPIFDKIAHEAWKAVKM